MSEIDDVIKSLKGDVAELIKAQLKELLNSSKSDSIDFIRETGKKVSEWLLARANNQINDQELEALLYTRDQALRQFKNNLGIAGSVRLETISISLINLVLDKIVGIAFT
jgi:uncharacterized protein YidB (DUF937 family)